MRLVNLVVDRVALGLVLFGGLVLMLSMVWTTADVIGTQLLGWPIPGSLEFVSNNMVFIVFGSLGYVQRRRGNIRVEFLYTRAGRRTGAAMDAVTHIAAIVFFGPLMWQATAYAAYSWHIRESTAGLIRFPVYPARFTIVVGVGLLLIQLLIDLATDVRGVMARQRAV